MTWGFGQHFDMIVEKESEAYEKRSTQVEYIEFF